jgi:predicted metalloprotease with PDZ domain
MIDYTIGWQQPNRHLFEVAIKVAAADAASLDFAIPNWRPGRYIIQNYARNIQEFSAQDERGAPLHWEKMDKSTWRVQTGSAPRVEVRYKYFANTLDAGASLLNEGEAYFNGTNLFMYLVGRRDQPCRLTMLAPTDWKIATALTRDHSNGEQTFLAADYEELSDSPVIASPTIAIKEYQQDNVTYHLAFQGKVEYEIDKLVAQVAKITSEQARLFGGAPFDNYWFLYHLTPGGRWHGVEHCYSTSITLPQSAFASEQGRNNFYSITSHEFFHVWNVKRIRPAVFNPPDYSRETYTRLLWFFEGVTSYYGDLMLRRAGVINDREYFAELTKRITELQNSPGRLIFSVEDASFNGWLQPDDSENVQLSFYTKGELLGLALDMEIRRRTEQAKSLDDVMRYLNEHYAQHNLGLPENGIQVAIETVTGGSFQEFFNRFVAGREEIPYNQFLALAGLQVTAEPDKSKPAAYLGLRLSNDEIATIINVYPDSPALAAGLDRGDTLLAINNRQANAANISEVLAAFRPNDRITVTVFRDRQLRNFEVALGNGGNLIYQIAPINNAGEAALRARANWLGNTK